jgi:hypothetical protein
MLRRAAAVSGRLTRPFRREDEARYVSTPVDGCSRPFRFRRGRQTLRATKIRIIDGLCERHRPRHTKDHCVRRRGSRWPAIGRRIRPPETAEALPSFANRVLWRARAATRVSSSLFFSQTFRHFVTRFDSWIAEYAIEMIVDSELLRRKCRCCGVTQIFQQFMAQSTFGNRNSRPHLREAHAANNALVTDFIENSLVGQKCWTSIAEIVAVES